MKTGKNLFFSENLGTLKAELEKQVKAFDPDKVAVLCDSNTLEHCWPLLADTSVLDKAEVLEVEPGEGSKSIGVTGQLWLALQEMGFSKRSLLVNLGGGMVSDLGGFIAATYKRGMAFINVPTTYLAMVDAAIGGKTGINLNGVKNQVGLVKQPHWVGICTELLNTLPRRQLLSGYAESIKHALIGDGKLWYMVNEDLEQLGTVDAIHRSMQVKLRVTGIDPEEKGIRKSLNFGHTVGHALEACAQGKLLHGEAVAWGIWVEGRLSSWQLDFAARDSKMVCGLVEAHYPVKGVRLQLQELRQAMLQDKKNHSGKINFSLLEKVGSAKTDCFLPWPKVEKVLKKLPFVS